MTTRLPILLLALFAGCGDGGDGGSGAGGPPYELGVTYSPKGWVGSTTPQDVIDFYSGHAAYGHIIAFHMNWRDSVAAAGQIPNTAVSAQGAASTYGFIPVVGFGWEVAGVPDLASEGEPANNTWSNAETRAEFQMMVTDYATQYQPRFLFLGNEANVYYLSHTAAEWADWISEFQACYDAVKAASPATVVFTTFQLERMKGAGVKNGWSDPPQWGIIADHGTKLDAVGFTTYPHFEYETPQDIPAGYYDEISTYWSGTVIFSEMAWLADPAAPYTGSAQEQSDFIPIFFSRTAALPRGYVVHLFLHDVDVAPPAFSMTGLRANDGTARPADATWKGYVP